MTNETYFRLEGEFLGVCAIDGYKLKYLQLRTADRDVIIKVPKELRLGMVYQLTIGDRLRCEGSQKDLKFKAHSIEKVAGVADEIAPRSPSDDTPRFARLRRAFHQAASPQEHRSAQSNQPIKYPAIESKVNILICQKSHCRNNGGKEIYSALTEQLDSHNLNDRVTLKSTGCLKCCKQAPNLVVLPERSRYHNVKVSQIPAIISKVRDRLSIEQN